MPIRGWRAAGRLALSDPDRRGAALRRSCFTNRKPLESDLRGVLRCFHYGEHHVPAECELVPGGLLERLGEPGHPGPRLDFHVLWRRVHVHRGGARERYHGCSRLAGLARIPGNSRTKPYDPTRRGATTRQRGDGRATRFWQLLGPNASQPTATRRLRQPLRRRLRRHGMAGIPSTNAQRPSARRTEADSTRDDVTKRCNRGRRVRVFVS